MTLTPTPASSAPESAERAAAVEIGSITVTGLHHRYPGASGTEDVLVDVSFEVAAGRSLALLGPSGCGKTTLLRAIAGLERPREGTVEIDKQLVSGPKKWVPTERRRIGMVFQDWALFPHLTVAKNVAYGLDRKGRRPLVEESLELVGLRGLGDRMPATLSGGQQQRVALARALAPRPQVLLLDEPFSNLDTGLRSEVRTEVRQLLLEVGMTAVFVTHDQEEAFLLGDRVAVMNGGRIVQIDTPHELYAEPTSPWVASFIGDANLLPGRATGRTATTALGLVPLTEEHTGDVEVLARPEELRLDRGDSATVQLIEFFGHDAMVHVAMGDQTLRVRTDAAPGVERGERVHVSTAQTHGAGYRAFPTGAH